MAKVRKICNTGSNKKIIIVKTVKKSKQKPKEGNQFGSGNSGIQTTRKYNRRNKRNNRKLNKQSKNFDTVGTGLKCLTKKSNNVKKRQKIMN